MTKRLLSAPAAAINRRKYHIVSRAANGEADGAKLQQARPHIAFSPSQTPWEAAERGAAKEKQ